MKAVVFDIGNVLVAWDPHAAFLPELKADDAVRAFLERVGFGALNLRADQGESCADLATEISDSADRALFASYPARFHLTIAQAIPETWDIARRLAMRGIALHGITNWSAETWPVGLATHPGLATLLDQIIVSGQERLLKPAPEIYARFCARTRLEPETCLFIDDSEKNVAGAISFGMEAFQFTTPRALEAQLLARGLL
ncbi:MAG: HAD family phosphatase [Rhodobacteraceae bacterium]|nr:MAG: HAD family phosphatase [Paracoccaceae bacterium]